MACPSFKIYKNIFAGGTVSGAANAQGIGVTVDGATVSDPVATTPSTSFPFAAQTTSFGANFYRMANLVTINFAFEYDRTINGETPSGDLLISFVGVPRPQGGVATETVLTNINIQANVNFHIVFEPGTTGTIGRLLYTDGNGNIVPVQIQNFNAATISGAITYFA